MSTDAGPSHAQDTHQPKKFLQERPSFRRDHGYKELEDEGYRYEYTVDDQEMGYYGIE
jgi:hypothetical protein